MNDAATDLSVLMRPTDRTVVVSGLACRVWTGRTNRGAAVSVLVHRLMIDEAHADQLDGTLLEQPPPTDPSLVGMLEQAMHQTKLESRITAQGSVPLREIVCTFPHRQPLHQFEYEP